MIHQPQAMAPVVGGSQRWIRDNQNSVVLGLMAWTLIVLMVVPDNFDYSSLGGKIGAPVAGSVVSRLLWLMLLGGGAFIVAWRAALSWLLVRTALNPFLLLFAALALASTLWSIEPAFTARRCVRLITILLDTLALTVMSWHVRRFQELIRPIITLLLAGSILFGLVCPTLAIHQETSPELLGAWRGLTNHKNSLGALAGTGLVLWLHAWWTHTARPRSVFLGIAISLICLVLSRSSTALVTAVLVSLVMALALQRSPRVQAFVPHLVILLTAALFVYALVILRLLPGLDLLLSPVAALTGKNLSFTGRADIWALISEHIQLHPFFGTGYGAYWIGPVVGSPSYDFVMQLHFYPGSAHNGYLEIVNDLGIVGLICLVGYIAVFLWQALQLLKVDAAHGALYLALILQQAISNLSETHWLSVLSVGFVVTTLATTSLARTLLENRLRRYFGEPDCVAPQAETQDLEFDHVAAA